MFNNTLCDPYEAYIVYLMLYTNLWHLKTILLYFREQSEALILQPNVFDVFFGNTHY